jgi:hypothetical protein
METFKQNKFGYCPECEGPLEPVWFTEEEYVTNMFGHMYRTGRKRRAVDYLVCAYCGKKQCVDDTFDGLWR